jgi:hypothetical protein
MKENYSYDREAWALEWGTFQHFLKTVSALKRVVFLSGDVHYALGASMEYWDTHTKTTAKFVDYTSSALSNEGAGSQIAILAIGYPRLLRLLWKQGTPTLDFFAWDINAGDHHILNDVLALIRQRFYLFWWSVPRLIAAHRSPYEIVLPARGWLKGAFKTFPPDRIYRIRYLRNTLSSPIPKKRYTLRLRLSTWILRPIRLALGGVTFLQTSVGRIRRILLRRARRLEQAPSAVPRPARALAHQAIHGTDLLERRLEKPRNQLVSTIFNYARWMNRLKAGELIIGCNNLGEISFEWNSQKKAVVQRLWWQFDDPEQPLQQTEYQETLELPAPDAAPPLP